MGNLIKPKKVPIRKCIVTNEQHPKKEMIRVVRSDTGVVVVDLTGKVRGRGAYVIKDKKAINLAKKKQIFARHLEVAIPDHIYEELIAIVEKGE